MTRIIAGQLGGRTIPTPRGVATRPTTDRVRESLFGRLHTLMDWPGARVLDLFAGSGALGLEACSRGAEHVLAIERHRPTGALLVRTIRDLDVADRVQVRIAPVDRVLEQGTDQPYDLVLADPPYPLTDEELTHTLDLLATHGWLAPDALLVIERSSRSPQPTWPQGVHHVDSRTYGESTLHLAEH